MKTRASECTGYVSSPRTLMGSLAPLNIILARDRAGGTMQFVEST
jgi:hypothetical protein